MILWEDLWFPKYSRPELPWDDAGYAKADPDKLCDILKVIDILLSEEENIWHCDEHKNNDPKFDVPNLFRNLNIEIRFTAAAEYVNYIRKY